MLNVYIIQNCHKLLILLLLLLSNNKQETKFRVTPVNNKCYMLNYWLYIYIASINTRDHQH